MTIRSSLMIAVSLSAVLASSAFAQNVSNTMAPAPQGNFQKLTPEQRQEKHEEMKEKLKSMTPEQREQFKAERKAEWQKRYDAATPEQQAKMRARQQQREQEHEQKLQQHQAAKKGGQALAPSGVQPATNAQ